MSENENNLNYAPIFAEFADRCRALGLAAVKCNADGSTDRFGDEADKKILTYLASSEKWIATVAEFADAHDGDSTCVSLLPGVYGLVVTCIPRRASQSFLLAVSVDARLSQMMTDDQWNVVPDEVRNRLLEMHAVTGGTSELEREHLRLILHWFHSDLRQGMAQNDELGNLSEELGDSYEVISLLLRIGENMNVAQQPVQFVRSVCHELREVVGFRWVGVRLLPGLLEGKSLAGGLVSEGEASLDRRSLLQQTTELLVTRDIKAATVLDTDQNPDLADYQRLGRQILANPLMRESRVIGGIFACDTIDEEKQIDWSDIKMVEAAASHLQIFLDNAALYDDIRLMFLGTLEALTASIDAKDPYTCGHSQRVAYMSRKLATAMNLDPKIVDRIHIAGLVHDVGKIGVPEAILRKPGRLTNDEFDMIKRHPDIGARILRDIPHFEDVLPGVLFHHERYDGKGYPRGLVGDDIPLFGRIIAVADSFDAMSSTRQYRKAMPREKVLEEMRDGAGTQFDPALVPIFLTLDYAEYDRMAQEHKATGDLNIQREAA